MKDKGALSAYLCFGGVLIGASCICANLGNAGGRAQMQHEAIQAGAAYWYADPATGETVLKWKCQETPNENAE